MEQLKTDVVGGVNSFIADQKKLPGEADFTLVQFDDQYELNYKNKTLKDVSDLTLDTYIPRGMTALLDAFGKTINEFGAGLASLVDSERPEKVIFVLFSDGLENSSKEFTYEKITEMVNHQREKYKWSFIFLGSNMDAIKEASKFGITKNHSITYSASPIGTSSVYHATSNLVGAMRCCSVNSTEDLSFSDEDRKNQEELLKKQ